MRLFQVNEDLDLLPKGHWYRWPFRYPHIVKLYRVQDDESEEQVQNLMEWLIESIDSKYWTVMGETREIINEENKWFSALVFGDREVKPRGSNSVFDQSLMNEIMFGKTYIFFARAEDYILFKMTWM